MIYYISRIAAPILFENTGKVFLLFTLTYGEDLTTATKIDHYVKEENMFLFKKIVAPLFAPLTLIIELLLIGLILLLFTKRQKTGKAIITFGVIMLATLGYGYFSDFLLAPLERQYPPLMIESTDGKLPSSDTWCGCGISVVLLLLSMLRGV